MLAIRKATSADLGSIAKVHVTSSRDAYFGVVPNDYLNGLNVEKSQDMWKSRMKSIPITLPLRKLPTKHFCILLRWTNGRFARNDGFEFEIFALHVHPDTRRRGIGSTLLHAAFERAEKQCQLNSAIVWTLIDLPLSCRFYEREGGTAIKKGVWQIGSTSVHEVAYGWSNLASILSRQKTTK